MSGRWIRFLGFMNAVVATVFGGDVWAEHPIRTIYQVGGRPEPGTLESVQSYTGAIYGTYSTLVTRTVEHMYYRVSRDTPGMPSGACTAGSELSAQWLCRPLTTGTGAPVLSTKSFCDDEYLYCDYNIFPYELFGTGCTCENAYDIPDGQTGICWYGARSGQTELLRDCQVASVAIGKEVTEKEYRYYFVGCGDPNGTNGIDSPSWKYQYVKDMDSAYDRYYTSIMDVDMNHDADKNELCAACPEIGIIVPGESYPMTGDLNRRYSDGVTCYYDRSTDTLLNQKDNIGIYDEVMGDCYYGPHGDDTK